MQALRPATGFGLRTERDGVDLSRAEVVREVIARAVATMGRIDILLNYAGIQHSAKIKGFSERSGVRSWR